MILKLNQEKNTPLSQNKYEIKNYLISRGRCS